MLVTGQPDPLLDHRPVDPGCRRAPGDVQVLPRTSLGSCVRSERLDIKFLLGGTSGVGLAQGAKGV
jgi:hypothetical protein